MDRWIRSLSLAATLGTLVLLPLPSAAQIALGVSGGVANSTFTGDDVDDDEVDARTGLIVGGWVNVPLSGIVSFTSGLYYVQKGVTDSEAGTDAAFKMDYLEVPLMLQVGLFQGESASGSVFFGPEVSLEVGCKLEASDEGASASIDCDADLLGSEALPTKSVLLGLIAGAGVRFGGSDSNMFFVVNGGLDLGLTSIDDSDDADDVKHSTWFAQVGIGWVVGN